MKQTIVKTMGKSLIGLLTILFFLAGCETMEGLGRDVEKVGGEIEEEADR